MTTPTHKVGNKVTLPRPYGPGTITWVRPDGAVICVETASGPVHNIVDRDATRKESTR